jgi:hypothetical protein
MHVKTKELGWKDDQGIQNIEASQGKVRVYQRQ